MSTEISEEVVDIPDIDTNMVPDEAPFTEADPVSDRVYIRETTNFPEIVLASMEELEVPREQETSFLVAEQPTAFFQIGASPRFLQPNMHKWVFPSKSVTPSPRLPIVFSPRFALSPLFFPSPAPHLTLPAPPPADPTHPEEHDSPDELNTTEAERQVALGKLETIFDFLVPLISFVLSCWHFATLLQSSNGNELLEGLAGMALIGSQFVLDWIFLLENVLEERLILRLWPLYLFGPIGHRIGLLLFILESLEGEDVRRYLLMVRMTDGLIFPSLRIIWILYIYMSGRNAYGMFKVVGSEVTDNSGNIILTPDNNFISLVCYILTLMKNLVILWRLYVPLATDMAGTETAKPRARMKGRVQTWLELALLCCFLLFTVIFRIGSYLIVCIHFNMFWQAPVCLIFLISVVAFIFLRLSSTEFFFKVSEQNYFLTAIAGAFVPAPTLNTIKAHNLMQVHSAFVDLILMLSLILVVILNLDYKVPIIRREGQIFFTGRQFFWGSLGVAFSMPMAVLMYTLYKALCRTGDTFRKTYFFENRTPTMLGVTAFVAALLILSTHFVLVLVGLASSNQCEMESPILLDNGYIEAGEGKTRESYNVHCDDDFSPVPGPVVYCFRHFVGNRNLTYLKDFSSIPVVQSLLDVSCA